VTFILLVILWYC